MRFREGGPVDRAADTGRTGRLFEGAPESVEARGLLALTYLNRGMEDRAIEEFERLAAAALPRIHYNLGMLRSRTGATRGRPPTSRGDRAGRLVRPATTTSGASGSSRRPPPRRGSFRDAEGRPELHPRDQQLGLVYPRREDATRALAGFSQGLGSTPPTNRRAGSLSRGISSNPRRTLTPRMGAVHYAQDNLDKAERLFIRALSHDPRRGRHPAISASWRSERDARGLIRRFREVLRIAPTTRARRHLALAGVWRPGADRPPLPSCRIERGRPAPPAPPGGGRWRTLIAAALFAGLFIVYLAWPSPRTGSDVAPSTPGTASRYVVCADLLGIDHPRAPGLLELFGCCVRRPSWSINLLSAFRADRPLFLALVRMRPLPPCGGARRAVVRTVARRWSRPPRRPRRPPSPAFSYVFWSHCGVPGVTHALPVPDGEAVLGVLKWHGGGREGGSPSPAGALGSALGVNLLGVLPVLIPVAAFALFRPSGPRARRPPAVGGPRSLLLAGALSVPLRSASPPGPASTATR